MTIMTTFLPSTQNEMQNKIIFSEKIVYRNEKIIPLHRRTIKMDLALQAEKTKFLVHENFFLTRQ